MKDCGGQFGWGEGRVEGEVAFYGLQNREPPAESDRLDGGKSDCPLGT